MKSHNKSIDTLKGALIIIVIIGHILLGSLDQSLLRYIIYSFHMPLFMLLSGYLINLDKLKSISIYGVVSKYLTRAIIPWGIAVVAYYILNYQGDASAGTIIRSFIFPFYHLWYVPCLVAFVILLRLLLILNVSNIMLVIFSLLMSIIAKLILLDQNLSWANSILYTIRFQFFFFFIIGMIIRNLKIALKSTSLLNTALIISIVLTVTLFFVRETHSSIIMFFVLNSILGIWIANTINNDKLPSAKAISWYPPD